VIEGKVLNDCATIVNCQMHGLNNCLSTALIAAFGDAGLNRNNNSNSVFQAAYVYVYVSERMMKKMNEDVGNDGSRARKRKGRTGTGRRMKRTSVMDSSRMLRNKSLRPV